MFAFFGDGENYSVANQILVQLKAERDRYMEYPSSNVESPMQFVVGWELWFQLMSLGIWKEFLVTYEPGKTQPEYGDPTCNFSVFYTG